MTLTGVVFVVFLILKLAGLVTWSWWVILAPIYVPIVILVIYRIHLKIKGWTDSWDYF